MFLLHIYKLIIWVTKQTYRILPPQKSKGWEEPHPTADGNSWTCSTHLGALEESRQTAFSLILFPIIWWVRLFMAGTGGRKLAAVSCTCRMYERPRGVWRVLWWGMGPGLAAGLFRPSPWTTGSHGLTRLPGAAANHKSLFSFRHPDKDDVQLGSHPDSECVHHLSHLDSEDDVCGFTVLSIILGYRRYSSSPSSR
jgi:hypothetical protein